ncbi:LPXTG cell wall anchor domain-containing protein [Aeromicrobium sp.]|uniref:LPXTG cell wall anchor domain-containing protein n=1 Tax=Aeromicrobium sp. TaxID=1871063 RepID=UPI003C5DFE4C
MFKLRLVAAAAIAAAATFMTAGAAQAYPDPSITITVSDATLVGGKVFDFKASASVDCLWTANYDGTAPGTSPTQTGTGKSISGSYKTKVVPKKLDTTLTVECKYDDAVAPAVARVTSSTAVTSAFYSTSPSTSLQAALQTASASATVTLLPTGGADEGNDDGALPDTGGSNLSWLVIGGVLVVVGGGVAYAARRRHVSH